MFHEYVTLDRVVQAGGKGLIKQELNSYPLYTRMVRLFGFTEIGIVATDDNGNERGRYASLSNERGEITEIRDYFAAPSIIVQAKEHYLMEILHRAERVKAHPFRAIAQYAPRFGLVQGSFSNIPAYVMHFLTNLAKMELTRLRPSL